MGERSLYDRIGVDYARKRRPDPRIAAQIVAALGDARSVVNVGAGTGNYEPDDRHVIALEPSWVMIEQRSPDAAPVVQAVAESLPFPDGGFDAALASLTMHQWTDPVAGLRELVRVSRRQVIFTWDAASTSQFWLVRDYLPEVGVMERPLAALDTVRAVLGPCRVEPVPVPHDCTDGFFRAYWRRPHAYLDPYVRASISACALLPVEVVSSAMRRLEADLRSGAWERRYGHLLELEATDQGYRLVVTA